jgi:hypothetical protein
MGGARPRRTILSILTLCLAVLGAMSCRSPGATEQETITPELTREPAYEVTFSVGETAESGQLGVQLTEEISVTVTELQLTDTYKYWRGQDLTWDDHKAPQGSTFIVADVKIKNLSNTDTRVGAIFMRGAYAGGTVMPGVYMAGRLGNEVGLELTSSLSPGKELQGKVLFAVPAGSTDYHVKYRFSEKPEVWATWLKE